MPPLSRGLRSLMSRSLSVSRTQTIPCQKSFHQGNLVINKEVSEALRNDGPVVTLESTIITHGMPYPTNMEMATQVRITWNNLHHLVHFTQSGQYGICSDNPHLEVIIKTLFNAFITPSTTWVCSKVEDHPDCVVGWCWPFTLFIAALWKMVLN